MNNSSLKIIFAGTPEFAVPTLQALINSPHQVISVYTQPDRPAGRGRKLTPSPVKEIAENNNLTLYQPEHFKEQRDIEALYAQQPDIMIVVAYGLILPPAVLEIPTFGCLNVHASLLPRWRGAAPIQRAILAGDRQTGVTIMQMDAGLDTGATLKTATVEISADETGQSLHDRLGKIGTQALLEVVDAIATGHSPQAVDQDDALAIYAHKVNKAEAEIDWSQNAKQLDRLVRAFNPSPVAYTHHAGQSLRIWQARPEMSAIAAQPGTVVSLDDGEIRVATGGGSLVLLQVQPAGKRRMRAADFINARHESLQPGTSLGI